MCWPLAHTGARQHRVRPQAERVSDAREARRGGIGTTWLELTGGRMACLRVRIRAGPNTSVVQVGISVSNAVACGVRLLLYGDDAENGIVLSLNALTHSLEIVPVICEIGFDNMHMHTHRFLTKLHESFGVLHITVEQMIEDLFLFLEYYLLIVAAFSLTFVGLGCAGMHDYADDFWTFDGVSTAAMWSIFGFLQPDKYETPLAMSTMYVYVLFANVTL
eukprot:5112721-Prymnesium_polylepis.1